ncbi:MAG: hypothetical protein AB7V46_24775 [Thermomicrobiales bacterium]
MRRSWKAARAACGRALVAVGTVVCFATTAVSATAFDALIGTWSGSGQIRYQDSSSERVRCTAYYSEGGERLRLAIRCNSDSNQIEIRGHLTQRGERVTGTWEERTFNASGNAEGRVSATRLNLSIGGGAFSGSMSVTYGGSKQTVVISTEGISMKSVTITLRKS